MKLIVGQEKVKEWINSALSEFGTIPKSSLEPPIIPSQKVVVDTGEEDEISLPPYRGKDEKRPAVRSIKSTRNENNMEKENLQNISDFLTSKITEIGEKQWSNDELHVPQHRGLSIAGIRKELEIATDKLQIANANPKLVIQMFERAVTDYKKLLKEPLRVIQAALKEYTKDLISTGLLNEEVKILKSSQGQAALATSLGFKEFFETWVRDDAPHELKKIYSNSEKMWFRSIFTIAQVGTLDLNNAAKAKRPLKDDFLMETSYASIPTIVDKVLILKDAGFRYYIAGLGGKHVYYWDWVRNVAAKHGKYLGQL